MAVDEGTNRRKCKRTILFFISSMQAAVRRGVNELLLDGISIRRHGVVAGAGDTGAAWPVLGAPQGDRRRAAASS